MADSTADIGREAGEGDQSGSGEMRPGGGGRRATQRSRLGDHHISSSVIALIIGRPAAQFEERQVLDLAGGKGMGSSALSAC